MKQRVGQYLMDAVYSAGADKVFGVPGDFNLAFLLLHIMILNGLVIQMSLMQVMLPTDMHVLMASVQW